MIRPTIEADTSSPWPRSNWRSFSLPHLGYEVGWKKRWRRLLIVTIVGLAITLLFFYLDSTNAASFLDELKARMPFPVRAIQVDGGSEFEAVFETECQTRGIRLFVLPPRSPKLNGGVERAHRTHTEEF